MKVVPLDKLTQLDKRYKYKMVTVKDEKDLNYFESVSGIAYKCMGYYYLPIGDSIFVDNKGKEKQ